MDDVFVALICPNSRKNAKTFVLGVGQIWRMEKLLDWRLVTYAIPPSDFLYAKEMGTAPGVEDLGSAPAYTLKAIPMFFTLFVAEFLIGLALGKKLYRINDFLTSICSGIVMLVVNSFTKTLSFGCYCSLYQNFRVVDLEVDSWVMWIGMFLSIDCGYYWMHRSAHTFHWMWSAHSVHHSGEDYNLATALRQGALQGSFSWLFYLPAALFFHPGVYVGHAALNTLGQFWFHTTIIGDLGPLEYILNTPSHHRMHHRPPGNCNYGAILIIWDRIFGTFVREDRQQEFYGLAKSHESFDPVSANTEHFKRMVADGNFMRFFVGKRTSHKWVVDPLAIFRAMPASQQSLWTLPEEPVREKYDPSMSASTNIYVLSQFVLLLVTALLFLMKASHFSLFERVVWAAFLLFSFSQLGRIIDGKSGANPFFVAAEAFRLVVWSGAVSSLA